MEICLVDSWGNHGGEVDRRVGREVEIAKLLDKHLVTAEVLGQNRWAWSGSDWIRRLFNSTTSFHPDDLHEPYSLGPAGC